jgi:hypothetical protein
MPVLRLQVKLNYLEQANFWGDGSYLMSTI